MSFKDSKYYVFETTDEDKDLIEYLFNHAECIDKQELKNNRKYVLIKKEKLFKAVQDIEKYKKRITDISNDKHVCHNCGCISNVFLMDYRGQICISKEYNCPFCHVLNNEAYNKVNQENLLKYL